MISIIGAGPAGNYAAYLLAKKGYEVRVFEEHPEIGKPVACTGIVTNAFREIIKEDSFIINKINTIRIFSPNNNFVEFHLKKPNLIIDRARFDNYLAEIAKKNGVEFFLNQRLKNFEMSEIAKKAISEHDQKNTIQPKGRSFFDKKDDKYILKILNIKNKKTKNFETDYLIGADGPSSDVAKLAGLYVDRKFFFGVQATARIKNENIVETYLLKNGFAWMVPENREIVRIGLCSTEKNYNLIFKDFLKKRIGKNYDKKILAYQAGLIPIFNKNIKTSKDNIFLIGDASAFTKAASAGGIIQSLISADCLMQAITKNISYENIWKKRLYKDLYYSLQIRKILDKFEDRDYNFLTKLFNQEKLKRILEEFDRDFPSKFVLKLLLKEPRLLYFIKFLF